MSAQITDSYFYMGDSYSLVALSDPVLFRPQDYGLLPQGMNTACYAGYWCNYEITDAGIMLKDLHINTEDGQYPPINGVDVFGGSKLERKRASVMGAHVYKDVYIPLEYTGRIVAGREFLKKYYIHMGYQRAWAYEELLEFVFEAGRLEKVVDHSEMAELIRMEMEESPKECGEGLEQEITAFVEDSFSLDLKVKCWWID